MMRNGNGNRDIYECVVCVCVAVRSGTITPPFVVVVSSSDSSKALVKLIAVRYFFVFRFFWGEYRARRDKNACLWM